jgi:hypothetical protein
MRWEASMTSVLKFSVVTLIISGSCV